MKKQTAQEVTALHGKIRQALKPVLLALTTVLVGLYIKDPAAGRELRRLVVTDVGTYFDEAFAEIEDALEKQARAERGSAPLWPIVAVMAVLFVVAAGASALNAFHVRHMTCTVTEKDRTTRVTTDADGRVSSSSDARLYTEDCGVLSVSDSLLSWHFNSADTYATVKEGRTYEVTTRGYRIAIFSMFPNVVEATEVKP